MARDYRAEYAARKARAAESGTTVYRQRDREARKLGYDGYQQRREARRTGQGITPVDRARSVKPGNRQIQKVGDITIVSTTKNGRGFGVIERQIRNAPEGAQVSINARVKLGDGTEKDITLLGRGGWSAAQLADALDGYDDIADFIADYGDDLYGFAGGVAAIHSVQVVIA